MIAKRVTLFLFALLALTAEFVQGNIVKYDLRSRQASDSTRQNVMDKQSHLRRLKTKNDRVSSF